jgi:hypothetical protein
VEVSTSGRTLLSFPSLVNSLNGVSCRLIRQKRYPFPPEERGLSRILIKP